MLLLLHQNMLLMNAAVQPSAVASANGGGKVRRRILTEHFDQVIATGRNPRRRVEQLLLARVI